VTAQADGTGETTNETTGETARRLTLLRHAKSDWPDDVPDHDRPLAKRGRKDAPRIGRWLRTHGYVPDIVICSTAMRTRQTWDLVRPELDGSAEVLFEPRAYAASALTLLYLCQELPAPCRAALLIGHNPGIEELAASLGGAQEGAPEPAGLRFPTAAVAVFEFTGDWSTLAPGQASLLAFTVPADLLRRAMRAGSAKSHPGVT
jgi:phosphohistidine phosphatase